MNKTKLVCIIKYATNNVRRLPKEQAAKLVAEEGFTYIGKKTFKKFMNRVKISF